MVYSSQVFSERPEFRPLLEPGLHVMSLDDLKILTVDGFSLSSTRSQIMSNLRTLLARLSDENVIGEAWVNGSFLTEKVDPEDVDVVFRFPASEYDDGSRTKRSAINWSVERDRHPDLRCDAYPLPEYPVGDPLQATSEQSRNYWQRWFGTDRSGEPKGIAVVRLADEELLPWNS